MPNREIVVHIVDDDSQIRNTTQKLLESQGFRSQAYASGQSLLESLNPSARGCLILDVHMPDINGLDLQTVLLEKGIDLPVIILTGFGDVPIASRAFRSGAVDVIEKPFQIHVLLDRVREALERERDNWLNKRRRNNLLALFNTLTAREKTLVKLVGAGYTAREIGQELCISHRTAETHRAKVMKKLEADSLADLISICMELEAALEPPDVSKTSIQPLLQPLQTH